MITNAAITIYNRRRSGRNSVLIPTVISEASWFYGRRAVRGQFIDSDDSYQVRIPYGADTSGKTYVNHAQYAAMADEEAAGYWTIQIDDIVLKGRYSSVVTDERELRELTDDLFVVNSFADNTIRGSNAVKHWRIGGL
jgi:hypothetical protein